MTARTEHMNTFTDTWAMPETSRLRLRVNDDEISTDKTFGSRWEATENGLATINVTGSLLEVDHAEIGMELWGGHPRTTLRRFSINGRRQHSLPNDGVSGGNCAYTFPTVPIDVRDLVTGDNAIQFSCSRGTGFWGHFIVDNLRLRIFHSDESDAVKRDRDLRESLRVVVEATATENEDASNSFSIKMGGRDRGLDGIKRVDYFGRYTGYAEEGGVSPISHGWKGYTKDRIVTGHLGSATQQPFAISWTDRELPRQPGPIDLLPVVTLENGLSFFGPRRQIDSERGLGDSLLYGAQLLPRPFWSRDGREMSATITVPDSLLIGRAILHTRFWDGADFEGESPVSLNGEPLDLVDGKASHDFVYKGIEIDPGLIRPGDNTLRVVSHTVHHGLEVLLPGPALQLWHGSGRP